MTRLIQMVLLVNCDCYGSHSARAKHHVHDVLVVPAYGRVEGLPCDCLIIYVVSGSMSGSFSIYHKRERIWCKPTTPCNLGNYESGPQDANLMDRVRGGIILRLSPPPAGYFSNQKQTRGGRGIEKWPAGGEVLSSK